MLIRPSPSRFAILVFCLFSCVAASAIEMVPVAAGTFTMGRRDDGDDGTHAYGRSNELPRHQVTLSAYEIGKFQVTNGEFADVLNCAKGQGYLKGSGGGAWTSGDVYASGQVVLYLTDSWCDVQYSAGTFGWKTRAGAGGNYSMERHPVTGVTWYGCVCFCNWLSEREGRTSAYDLATWELVDADPGTPGIQFTNGYRLPTEAERERAAAWDGSKHWIYGFASDTLTGSDRCNYWGPINPMGLTAYPYTSPVGWFNGVNVSPNGSVQTVDSPSPAGCYDMSGNVLEWCHDRYETYGSGAVSDPKGPASGSYRVMSGGAWANATYFSRSAYREGVDPVRGSFHGFRVARVVALGGVKLTVSPDDSQPMYFGAQPVGGAVVERTFTVQNVGQNSLTGTATVAAPFSVVSGGSYNLAPGASATVTVRYTPSVAGSSARLVTFSGAGVTLTRRVTGAAGPPTGGIGTIHGKVTIADGGRAVTGAKVQPYAVVTDEGGHERWLPFGDPAYSLSQGDYTLDVAPDTYILTVTPDDQYYQELLDRVDIPSIVVPSGGNVLVNVSMTQHAPPSADPKEIPVVLVRGAGPYEGWSGGESKYWQAMRDYLRDPARGGFKNVWECNEPETAILSPWTGTPGYFIDGRTGIKSNAWALKSYIEQKVEQYKNKPEHSGQSPAQINILAHSMGGLITRKMLTDIQTRSTSIPHVGKVVMLSTPNAGSALADDPAKSLLLAEKELAKQPPSVWLAAIHFALQAIVLPDSKGWESTHDLRTANFLNGQSDNFSALNPWQTDTGTRLYLMGGAYRAHFGDAGLTFEDRGLALTRSVMQELRPADPANDGMVSIWSAQGYYYDPASWPPVWPPVRQKCFRYANPVLPFMDWGTNHAQAKTDPRVLAWVGNVLAGTATASSGASRLMPTPLNIEAEPTTLTRVEVDMISGVLALSGHREVAIPCDALSSFTLLLSYDAKAISFSLRNPAGATILPSGFHPAPGVQYVALDTTATAGGIACYTVSAPSTGTWTAILDAPSTASATVPWTLWVTGYGALDVAPTGGSLFHPAEEVLLSCFVYAVTPAGDAVTSVTGAVAEAFLTGPTGGLTTCTLLDDGAHWDGRMLDGQYAGLAQGLTLAGDYAVVYRVDGTDPATGAAFRRVKRGALSISSGNGFIAGNLSHRSFDIDGDGRAERIGLECQVSVAGATTGTLTCDLVDPSGTVRISAAQEFVRTAPGTTAVTLLFDNGAIGVPGIFGPWKVENLQFFEQRDGRAYWMDTWPGAYSVNVTLTGPGTYGGLQVMLAPPEAVAAGAQWRIVDDPTTTTEPCWRGSDDVVAGITPGNYGVAFRPLVGWIAPTTRTVSVVGGETLETTGTYSIRQFTVRFQTDGTAGATLTGATSQTVNYGTDCTAVTANAPVGWHFVRWSDGVQTAARTDRNVTADLTLTATFAINRYHLAYAAGVNGSIDGATSQTVNHGASGTAVTATPATGFHFVQWSDGVLTAARTDANVTADVSVTASFAINRYHLAYSAVANGSVDGATSQTVNHGASGTAVTAHPVTGYHFVRWSDGVLTAARTDANVTADVSVTAAFAINRYHLAYGAGANGSVTGATSQTLNHGASGTTVTAVAATGHHFLDWSDSNTSNPRRDLDVTVSLSVTANFAANPYTVVFQTDGTAGATLTGTAAQTVDYGTDCTAVAANAPAGWHFVKWTKAGAFYSFSNPLTVRNVTEDMTLTATFAAGPPPPPATLTVF